MYAEYENYIKKTGEDTLKFNIDPTKTIQINQSDGGYEVDLVEDVTTSTSTVTKNEIRSYQFFDYNKDGIVDGVFKKEKSSSHTTTAEEMKKNNLITVTPKSIINVTYPIVIEKIGEELKKKVSKKHL